MFKYSATGLQLLLQQWLVQKVSEYITASKKINKSIHKLDNMVLVPLQIIIA